MTSHAQRRSYSDVDAIDVIHQASTLYSSTKVPHDYGTGEIYTSVEVHTLKHIADNPGITVTELAGDLGKTKGAVSQLVKKLETKGLIQRGSSARGDNRQPFSLTEKGTALNDAHASYDEAHAGESMSRVREEFSDEEINTAFSVLECWVRKRREVQAERMGRSRS